MQVYTHTHTHTHTHTQRKREKYSDNGSESEKMGVDDGSHYPLQLRGDCMSWISRFINMDPGTAEIDLAKVTYDSSSV